MFVDQSFEVPLKLACYIPVLDEKSKLHVLRHGRSRQIRARHENGVPIGNGALRVDDMLRRSIVCSTIELRIGRFLPKHLGRVCFK